MGTSGDHAVLPRGDGFTPSVTWDPAQYLLFAEWRLRAALDLLTHVEVTGAAHVVDLGTGTGVVLPALAERFPQAALVAVDNSAEMLERARREVTGLPVTWLEADAETWRPEQPVDVLYSNATLQWLGDHPSLLPRLLSFVRPGGVLAVQMPRNYDAPSHRLAAEAAMEGPWRDRLAPLVTETPPVTDPLSYLEILAPHSADVDLWETEYLHVLEGDEPVVEWVKGTALRPFLDALEEPDRTAFEDDYRRRVAAAYPALPDGRTVLPFRRLFFVARR